jgi:hypothetical protein
LVVVKHFTIPSHHCLLIKEENDVILGLIVVFELEVSRYETLIKEIAADVGLGATSHENLFSILLVFLGFLPLFFKNEKATVVLILLRVRFRLKGTPLG